MIIASSLAMAENGASETMLLLLLAGWFATQSFIADSRRSSRAECAFYRRELRRRPR